METFDASGTRSGPDDSRVVSTRIRLFSDHHAQIGEGCILPLRWTGGVFVLDGAEAPCRLEKEAVTVVSVSGQEVDARGHVLSLTLELAARDASGALVRYVLRAGDSCERGSVDCRP